MLKRIVILGPESTGKSTLCTQLATHFGTSWVPEFARDYLHEHDNAYTLEDLPKIAAGQLQAEDAAAEKVEASAPSQPFPLFIDTDMYVMKIWSEIVYNSCDNRILMQIAKRHYDLYLLCDTDLPWVQDPLREQPSIEARRRIYQHYKDALINQHVPWVEIKGEGEERVQVAVAAVHKYGL